MNIWKRAWISILRRRASSFVLLLIVFVLANVLLTTLTVTSSMKSTRETVLKQYPPVVKVSEIEDLGEPKKAGVLTLDKAKSLYDKTRDIVKSFDYKLNYSLNYEGRYVAPQIEGIDSEYATSMFVLNISGTQLNTPTFVQENVAKIISGNGFSDVDINEGKPKIMVSKQWAQTNNLEVGSMITLDRTLTSLQTNEETNVTTANRFFEEPLEFEIVGIVEYKEIEEFSKKNDKNTKNIHRIENNLISKAMMAFIPNNYIMPLIQDDLHRVKEESPDNYESYYGTRKNAVYPTYTLKDMKDLDAFLKAAEEVYDKDSFSFHSAAKEYEILAKPMNSMENLLDIIFKITVVMSVVVLSLILCIFVYLRQKEMGVYLALGEKHKNIIGQLLIETIIVSIVGATLAILTSMFFSEMLASNTMQSLLETTTKIPDGLFSPFDMSYHLSPEIISQQYQGGFTVVSLLVFYGVMLVTILTSQIVTVFYLLRLNPKKILM